ncbi:MAG: hypothetical protein AB7O45_13095 [Alphaproteobacteria bacterium]
MTGAVGTWLGALGVTLLAVSGWVSLGSQRRVGDLHVRIVRLRADIVRAAAEWRP